MNKSHLVAGISSAGRRLPRLDGETLKVSRSQGPYIYDQHGRRYIDTAMGFGATMLGHGDSRVVAAVSEALARGPMPAYAHEREEAAAAALAARTGQLDRVIFVNTGSEAVHLACRAARAHTGRQLVAKFAAGYDGWYDEVAFGNVGSTEAASMERPVKGRMTLLRYNDFDDVERLFAEHSDVAAIVIEPVLANAGCITPLPGYLQHLTECAHRHGALVVLDEVLMGFRLHAGLTGQLLGVDADLAAVGKAIGSGLPVAAVVGRESIMAGFEQGAVVHAGTYNGSPPVCEAVIATMGQLEALDYPALLARGERLQSRVRDAFQDEGISLTTSGYGTVFTLWPGEHAPQDYAQAQSVADIDFSLRLHETLRRLGLLVMPSPYGRLYLSRDHDEGVVDEIGSIVARAASAMAGRPTSA